MTRPPVEFAPSILNADHLDLRRAVGQIARGGADRIHVDVMDGHFVPNLSMGPQLVRSLSRGTDLPLDVHLMVTNPARFLDAFLDAGAGGLTLHAESRGPLRSLLRRIRRRGARAAIALRPGTALRALSPYLGLVDMVLLMTVEPGFGGQRFEPRVVPKIAALRRILQKSGRRVEIQVDGGVNRRTLPAVVRAGADVVVAGWAIFGDRDPVNALRTLRRRARAVARGRE